MKEIKGRPVHRVAQELVDSSGFLLARLGVAFKTQAVARMEEAGYDTYDYSVLAILAEGAREAQATIAGALGLDPGRLVALLDSLEQRGLVTRQRDPQDRRRHVVTITDIGKVSINGCARSSGSSKGTSSHPSIKKAANGFMPSCCSLPPTTIPRAVRPLTAAP